MARGARRHSASGTDARGQRTLSSAWYRTWNVRTREGRLKDATYAFLEVTIPATCANIDAHPAAVTPALGRRPRFELRRRLQMSDIVIVGAARTAIGKFGGGLAQTPAPELGASVIRALLARANLKPDQISEVILGQVLTGGSGQNPARQALIKAGLPAAIPGMTINKVCGSRLKAVMLAWQAVQCGDADIVA